MLIMRGYKKDAGHVNWIFYKKLYQKYIRGNDMKTYQLFVVPIGNAKIIEK